MYFSPLESDQLFTWSDENRKSTCGRLEKTSSSPRPSTASTPGDPSRLSDRALQALWQARVQMRGWPRSRTQVLSVGELSRPAATNGLCAAGVARSNRRVRCQLPPSPRDFRCDFRDQPRVAAPPGGALSRRHERRSVHPPCVNRCWIGWRAPRQYDRSLACRQPGRCVRRGGSQ